MTTWLSLPAFPLGRHSSSRHLHTRLCALQLFQILQTELGVLLHSRMSVGERAASPGSPRPRSLAPFRGDFGQRAAAVSHSGRLNSLFLDYLDNHILGRFNDRCWIIFHNNLVQTSGFDWLFVPYHKVSKHRVGGFFVSGQSHGRNRHLTQNHRKFKPTEWCELFTAASMFVNGFTPS